MSPDDFGGMLIILGSAVLAFFKPYSTGPDGVRSEDGFRMAVAAVTTAVMTFIHVFGFDGFEADGRLGVTVGLALVVAVLVIVVRNGEKRLRTNAAVWISGLVLLTCSAGLVLA